MEKKVLLAKKDCIRFLWAPLNDQYTDGSIWSIDDKDRCPESLLQKETSKSDYCHESHSQSAGGDIAEQKWSILPPCLSGMNSRQFCFMVQTRRIHEGIGSNKEILDG